MSFAFVDTDKVSLETAKEKDKTLLHVNADKPTMTDVDTEQKNKPAIEKDVEKKAKLNAEDVLSVETQVVADKTSEVKPAESVEKIEKAEKAEIVFHKVIYGETLYSISLKYNVKMKALRKWNKISTKHKLQINKKLYVVNPETVTNIND